MMLLNGLLALIIVYIPNQLHFPSDLGIKGLNLMNILMLIAFLLLLILRVRTSATTPLKGSFVIFFVVSTFALLIGTMRDGSQFIEDLTVLKNAVFYMLLYFLYYHAVQERRTIRFLFVALLFVAFVASVEAIREAIAYGIGNFAETHRASGPFGVDYRSANTAGVFFVIFLPLFQAVFLFYREHPLVRFGALGCMIIMIAAIFFTYSRQAYFIAALVVLLMAWRRNVLLSVVVAIALMFYDVWVPDSVVERIQMTEQATEEGARQIDESTASRPILWAGAWQLFLENPLGIGLNHFKREIGRVTEYEGMDAHNFYFRTLAEMGVPGIIALLILFVGMYRLGRKVQRLDQSVESQVLGVGYSVSVISLALGNFYGSRFFDGELMGNFWILTALVARYLAMFKYNADGAGSESRLETNQGAISAGGAK